MQLQMFHVKQFQSHGGVPRCVAAATQAFANALGRRAGEIRRPAAC
jgi:hypothetical protein